jgi:hypothetical protein
VTSPTDTEVGIRSLSTVIPASATPNLLGQHPASGRIGLGQEHDELVPAEPGPGVDPADPVADDLPHGPQRPVAREVAVPVVDALELVEVDHQQAEPAPGPLAPGELALQRREQVGTRAQPGQGVDGRVPEGGLARPTLLAAKRQRGCERDARQHGDGDERQAQLDLHASAPDRRPRLGRVGECYPRCHRVPLRPRARRDARYRVPHW